MSTAADKQPKPSEKQGQAKSSPQDSAQNSITSEIQSIQSLQRLMGNRYLTQAAAAGTLNPLPGKGVSNRSMQHLIQPRPAPAIQRMRITRDSFLKDIPEFKTFEVGRQQIAKQFDKYQKILEGYEKRFPTGSFHVTNDYYQGGLKQIQDWLGLTEPMVHNFKIGLEKKVAELGVQDVNDDPHNRAIRKLGNMLLNNLHPNNPDIEDFRKLHHSLVLKATGEHPDFEFLGPKNRVGNQQQGAAQGGVNMLGMSTFNTPQGKKTGYTKDDQGQVSDAGKGIGIDSSNAKSSLRSVATYEISELMQLGIIPYTALTKEKKKIGSFMERHPVQLVRVRSCSSKSRKAISLAWQTN
jgi:hypothetical protein